MDLLDAIEELEQPTNTCSSTKTIEHEHDFVERQVLYVQEKLRELWLRKRGEHVQSVPCIPFYWVFSHVLRLIEEYPDGLTQAVVLAEMSKLLKHKVARDTGQEPSVLRKKRKFRDTKDLEDFFAENEQEAMQAKVLSYGNHRLTLEKTDGYDVVIHMYLHKRFRFCIDFLHDKVQNEPRCVLAFPFQASRKVAFTNVKALERKDTGERAMERESEQAELTLLPTSFLSVRLEERFALDRKLLADAISLAQVDQLVNGVQDETAIQQLMVKVRVLDIGAIRPCQTPLYVQRQVILLGEVEETNSRLLGGPTPNTQQMMQGLHLMVLWDEQVVLSRLFCVNDTIAIVHPFVHLCAQRHAEIVHVLSEYSSQQHVTYFFEYGSATVLFCKPCQVSTLKNPPATAVQLQGQSEVERRLLNLEDIKPGWYNFSLYAHVRSIRVSHGIPLLAAFFHAYYDDKTNHSTAGNASMQSPLPLDRTIVSKYYLVVLLQVYVTSSERLLTIEVTGDNALAALRLHPGHSVYVDGLVTMDLRSHKVRRFRNTEAMALASSTSKAQAAFAFSTTAYNMPPSGVVALCSDWNTIFGNQSLFSNNCKLKVLNTTAGLMNTTLDRSSLAPPVDDMTRHALAMVEMTVASIGWLILSDNNLEAKQMFTIDSTCEQGHSTTCAHKNCFRPVQMMARAQHPATGPPKWQCQFCHELFLGLQDTVQTFCELVVILENGQAHTSPIVILCQGPTVESLLGTSAEGYRQLPLAQKRKTIENVLGTSLRLMISQCEPRHVSVSSSTSTLFQHHFQPDSTMTATATAPRTTERTINFRMDMVQIIDTLAATPNYLATLHEKM